MSSNTFGFVVDQNATATAAATPSNNFSSGGNSFNLLFSKFGGGGAASGDSNNNSTANDFSAAGPGTVNTVGTLVNAASVVVNGPRLGDGFENLLDDLGLSMASMQASNGQVGADRLPRILNKLTPSSSHSSDGLSAAQKVQLSRALLQWHSLAYRDIRSKAVYQNAHLILHSFTNILFLPDDMQHG